MKSALLKWLPSRKSCNSNSWPSFTSFPKISTNKRLFRYRAKDYRIYFERAAEGITVHRVLHKNTIRDFLFRAKLPMTEDDQLGQQKGFWKLIEEGEKSRRR